MIPAAGSRYGLLFILSSCGFVTSFGAHIVATNLPAYADTVGAGAFTIGLLIATYDFAELFAKPAAGFAADRFGLKLVLLAGLGVFILGSLLFLGIPSRLLLVVRLVQGLGAAALSTVSITLVAKYFASRRGQAFGIYNAIKGGGYVVAPAAGGFLTARYGFSMIFITSAAVGAVALALSLRVPVESAGRRSLDDDDDLTFAQFVSIFQDRRLRPIYAAIVVNMFLVGILFGFLPVYLHGIGYSVLESGMVLSVATAAYLLVQPLSGMLADRFEARRTVIIGLILAALTVMAATFTSGIALMITVVCAGIGVGTVWTNCDALIANLADSTRLGASIGAAQSFKEFGDMVGPLLIGAVTHFFGIRVGFVVCGALALGCVLPLIHFSAPSRA